MIQGNYYSEEFQYVEIKLRKCNVSNPAEKCVSKQEQDKMLSKVELNLAFINSYVDASNFEEVI